MQVTYGRKTVCKTIRENELKSLVLKHIIFIALSLILCSGCKKDPPINEPCAQCSVYCQPIPESPSWFGWNNNYENFFIRYACFNPNDSAEILIEIELFGYGPVKIYKYNLISEQLTFIHESSLFFRSKWGKNDWILLSRSDGNIWKIKSNGDSLIQLTFSGNNFGPIWSFDCTKIAFSKGASSQLCFIMDVNGQILDSLYNCKFQSDLTIWNYQNNLISFTCEGVHLCDVNSDSSTSIAPYPDDECSPRGIAFIGNDTLVWSTHRSGVYRTLLSSDVTSALINSCDAEVYRFPSYHPSSNKLLWTKTTTTPSISNNTLYIESNLILMSPNGEVQEIIELPL